MPTTHGITVASAAAAGLGLPAGSLAAGKGTLEGGGGGTLAPGMALTGRGEVLALAPGGMVLGGGILAPGGRRTVMVPGGRLVVPLVPMVVTAVMQPTMVTYKMPMRCGWHAYVSMCALDTYVCIASCSALDDDAVQDWGLSRLVDYYPHGLISQPCWLQHARIDGSMDGESVTYCVVHGAGQQPCLQGV
jgi:hypothetical protein